MQLTKADIRFCVALIIGDLKEIAEYTDAQWDNTLIPILEWLAENWIDSWLTDEPASIVANMPQAMSVGDLVEILPEIIVLIQQLLKIFAKRKR